MSETFVLNQDGSGSLEKKMHLIPQVVEALEATKGLDKERFMMGMDDFHLPVTEAEIRAYCKGEGLKLKQVKIEKAKNGGLDIEYSVEFESVQKYAKSKAAGLFTFEIKKDKQGTAVFYPNISMFSSSLEQQQMDLMDKNTMRMGFAFAKLYYRGMKYTLKATLPNTVLKTDAQEKAGKTVTWKWEIDTMKYEDNYDKKGQPIRASAVFSAEKLGFTLPIKAQYSEYIPKSVAKEKKIDKEKKEVEVDPQFKAIPESFDISRSINFDKNGKATRVSDNVRLDINVYYPSNIYPRFYSNVELDQVLTDTMENLAKKQHNWGREGHEISRFWGRNPFDKDEKPSFNMNLYLEKPKRSFNKFIMISGRFTLKYAKKVKEVKFGPVKDLIGKQLEAEEFGNNKVFLKSIEKRAVTIKSDKSFRKNLKKIMFVDGNGKEVSRGGSSGSGGFGGYTHTYRISLPMDGSIVFYFYQDLEEKEVGFLLKDVSLETENDDAFRERAGRMGKVRSR
jgi:hypothetical protein